MKNILYRVSLYLTIYHVQSDFINGRELISFNTEFVFIPIIRVASYT